MNVEQRLSRLEAIEAIKRLKARYFHACDTKQPDIVRECFAAGDIDLSEGLARVIFAGATAPQELDDPGKQAG
jgi:hypothetical protein